MIFYSTILLNANGLFDFDLTFPIEALLFLILSIVITFIFLSPIANQLEERAVFLEYTIRKSMILITFGYDQLENSVNLLLQEITELNRQVKVLKKTVTKSFENEISKIQKDNLNLLTKIKTKLIIRSANLFASLTPEIEKIANKFFDQRFQSN
jgi:hypothetical protein